jgi:hypothetical protein
MTTETASDLALNQPVRQVNDHVQLLRPRNFYEANLQEAFVELTGLVSSGRANRRLRRKHQAIYGQLKRLGLVVVTRG